MVRRFLLDKKVGETPLAALERARKHRRIAPEVPLAYAGRLDPMASGKLLILVGDECKRQTEYHALDKEYEVEVLLGLGSDTGDILGIIEKGPVPVSVGDVRKLLPSFVGPYTSPYPAYSSKTVEGKPLFQWTLEGRLNEIEVPLQTGHLRRIEYKGMRRISSASLMRYVEKKIGTLVPVLEASKALGRDFRKVEALASWKKALGPDERLRIVKIRVRTSAGVYMRTLAEDIGNRLGTRALALSIRRTRIYLP